MLTLEQIVEIERCDYDWVEAVIRLGEDLLHCKYNEKESGFGEICFGNGPRYAFECLDDVMDELLEDKEQNAKFRNRHGNMTDTSYQEYLYKLQEEEQEEIEAEHWNQKYNGWVEDMAMGRY